MIVHKLPKGILVNGDCLKALKKVRTESVDLVFADPPFNIGLKYDDYGDSKDQAVYLSWVATWMKELRRVIKRDGSIFVAIGDKYVAEYKRIIDPHFHMRNWIIWRYNFGVYCTGKFGRDHTHVLYYTRSPKGFKFRSDRILVPSARQTKYNDKRAQSKGRIPGDVWDFPRVCGTFKERNKAKHPCQMPEAILDRIVKVASDPGDVVLDPFAGSGTTLVVAKKLGRRFIGMEISENYCRGILDRLKAGNSSLRSRLARGSRKDDI
jgi:site-specific DNA-methyltransferase (adenine-specific)